MVKTVEAADAPLSVYDYPGAGHLFTDASLPKEYDADASELLWRRVIAFCAEPLGYTDPG